MDCQALWQLKGGALCATLYHFCITPAFEEFHPHPNKYFIMSGELAGNRTQDPRLKRALLYQLSYELTT